jgi:RNA polymerase sigma-70 factor (ECF subfamily)
MTIENEDDRQKAAEIFRLYGSIMLYTANNILHDRQLAEDAVSEAFIKILDNLDKIDLNDCYRTRGFVVIIVRHVTLNMLKRQNRNMTVPLDDNVDFTDNQNVVFEDISIKEACSRIAEAIAGLDKKYSDVLYLKIEMDYSNEEISNILGISQDNVRMRLSRARQALMKQLRKEEIYNGG